MIYDCNVCLWGALKLAVDLHDRIDSALLDFLLLPDSYYARKRMRGSIAQKTRLHGDSLPVFNKIVSKMLCHNSFEDRDAIPEDCLRSLER